MKQTSVVKIVYPGERVISDIKIEGSTREEVLENTFAAFNHGSGKEHETLKGRPGCRSMSKNDLVQVGGVWFQCESFGWKEVTEEYVNEIDSEVRRHPLYKEHGAWFALSDVMYQKRK